MSGEADAKACALALVEEGLTLHLAGQTDDAIDCYSASLALAPTAEAYTYRGWAYSQQGLLDEAIAECRRAIELDPSFGNPYNDLGSYLILQDRLDEAVEWLERAKTSIRYDARHYPYLNLGRIYVVRGWLLRAREEFLKALELHPGDKMAQEGLAKIDSALN